MKIIIYASIRDFSRGGGSKGHFDPLGIILLGVEIRSGQSSHVLSRSNKSDLVYKISGPDPDSALNHVH